MKRYGLLSKPKAADWEIGPDAENYLARTVYEKEPTALETGILDQHGNMIHVFDEMEPIGFCLTEFVRLDK